MVRPENVRQLIVLGVLVLLGSAACGQNPEVATIPPHMTIPSSGAAPPLTSGVPTMSAPPTGSAAWESFPVDRKPRPIVLISPPPSMAGFTTDAAKLAALSGNFELAAELPVAPPTVTAQLPDGPAEFPTLPAERALADLRGTLSSFPAPNPTDALPITRVELGSAEFQTDRGPLALPAWLFHPVEALGPIGWPALPPEALWPHQVWPSGTPPAQLAADGTLTVHLPAAPSACPGELVYRVVAATTESATTVSVIPRSMPVSTAPGPSQPNCAHDLAARFEPHQVKLAAPLGARVLVDNSGAPIAVTR